MTHKLCQEQLEREVFQEFADRSPLTIIPGSIENRCPPEPDILCRLGDGESVAFELKGITEERLAETEDYYRKSKDEIPQFVWGENPTRRIVKTALKKQYVTEHPMELLVYIGLTSTDPDSPCEDTQSLCEGISHRFRRVWFMGAPSERLECVYRAEDYQEV